MIEKILIKAYSLGFNVKNIFYAEKEEFKLGLYEDDFICDVMTLFNTQKKERWRITSPEDLENILNDLKQ